MGGVSGGQFGTRQDHTSRRPNRSPEDLATEPDGSPAAGTHRHGRACNHRQKGWKGILMRPIPDSLLSIVGLDLYTKGRAAEGISKADGSSNPFDLGIVRNCTDFWTRGRTLGVDYVSLYDIPPEGFARAIAARRRAADAQASSRSRNDGYVMVSSSQEEV